MQAEALRREDARRDGMREGARRMRADMTTLFARHDEGLDHRDEDGIHLTSVIDKFPSPSKNGPFLRYAMPMGPAFGRFLGQQPYPLHERVQTIDFQATEYAITQHVHGGSVSLRWFTWEPREHRPENGEIHRVLLRNMGRLSRAEKHLEWLATASGLREHFAIEEARRLLRDSADELRRRAGVFHPEATILNEATR